MKKKIKIGIIGCGAIAQKGHLPFYNNDKNIELFVADVNEDRLKEVARKFNIKQSYTDFNAMLKDVSLDGLSICVPNALHAKMAVAAAESGVNILCEKPMALDISQGQRMIKSCEDNKVILMINFTHRFFSGTIKTKQLLEQSEIGQPHTLRIRYVHKGPYNDWAKSNWFYNPKLSGGGVLMDMGVHAVDICHYFFGPVEKVTASVASLNEDICVEDSAVLLVEFSKGRRAFIEVAWTGAAGFTGIEVSGSKGAIVMDFCRGLFLSENNTRPDGSIEFYQKQIDCDVLMGGWETGIKEFIKCLKTGTKPPCDGFTGLAALDVVLCAYKSASLDRKVRCNALNL